MKGKVWTHCGDCLVLKSLRLHLPSKAFGHLIFQVLKLVFLINANIMKYQDTILHPSEITFSLEQTVENEERTRQKYISLCTNTKNVVQVYSQTQITSKLNMYNPNTAWYFSIPQLDK